MDYILIRNQPLQKTINSFEVYQDHSVMIGPKNCDIQKIDKIPLITYRESDLFTEDFLKRHFSKKIVNKCEIIASVNSHRAMIDFVKTNNCFAVIPLSSLPSKEKKYISFVKTELNSHCLYLCTRHNLLANKFNNDILKFLINTIKVKNQ